MKKFLVISFSFIFCGLIGCASKSKVSPAEQVKMTVLETIPRGDQPNG